MKGWRPRSDQIHRHARGRATKQQARPAYPMAATCGHYRDARERRPEKVAALAFSLYSDAAAFITGKAFRLMAEHCSSAIRDSPSPGMLRAASVGSSLGSR